MKQIILIGTLHLGLTPKKDLIAEISKHKPDKLLIELTEEEVVAGANESNRDEMFVALNYAVANHISYELYDVDFSTLLSGITGSEPDFVELHEEIEKCIRGKGLDWKQTNQPGSIIDVEINKIDRKIVDRFFDKDKIKKRNQLLAKNIEGNLIEGNNVVVTGSGHIDHLLRDLPGSIAPLRANMDFMNKEKVIGKYVALGLTVEEGFDEAGKVYERHKHETTYLWTAVGSIEIKIGDGDWELYEIGSECVIRGGEYHEAKVGKEGWGYIAGWNPEEAKKYEDVEH